MHILFVHQNFPAQFGHIAEYLAQRHGFRCSFVSEKPAGRVGSIERIQYQIRSGATAANHYCSRTFENAIWHTHAVFEALKARPDIQPDLVVGHSGFGSTLFLRQLYPCPIINYFEYFYRATNSDMDFRPDFPTQEIDRLRAMARNAMILLDLENCDAGYSPMRWQRDRLPELFHDKVRVIFDGIDTQVWRPHTPEERVVAGQLIPADRPIVTYVSRGFESMRGFDIFMKSAKKLYQRRPDVLFVVVGTDRIAYGGDDKVIGQKSFKDWVMARDIYEPSNFLFLGLVPPAELARLFCLSQLHIYLTVPFVLSWSLLNALACGTTVLASNTAPVREVIEPGRTGLLVDFFDIDRFAETADQVLADPAQYRPLGQAGAELVRQRYSLDVCLPQMLQLYQEAVARRQA